MFSWLQTLWLFVSPPVSWTIWEFEILVLFASVLEVLASVGSGSLVRFTPQRNLSLEQITFPRPETLFRLVCIPRYSDSTFSGTFYIQVPVHIGPYQCPFWTAFSITGHYFFHSRFILQSCFPTCYQLSFPTYQRTLLLSSCIRRRCQPCQTIVSCSNLSP